MLILVLVLKDSSRTYFKSLSLSWSLGSGPCPWGSGPCPWGSGPCPGPWWSGPCPFPGPWGQVLVLVLGGQVLVNTPANGRSSNGCENENKTTKILNFNV